jgi:hypothetical protein
VASRVRRANIAGPVLSELCNKFLRSKRSAFDLGSLEPYDHRVRAMERADLGCKAEKPFAGMPKRSRENGSRGGWTALELLLASVCS